MLRSLNSIEKSKELTDLLDYSLNLDEYLKYFYLKIILEVISGKNDSGGLVNLLNTYSDTCDKCFAELMEQTLVISKKMSTK